MIEEYLRQIDELLSTSPAVSSIEVIRRSIRDTGVEKVLNYRYHPELDTFPHHLHEGDQVVSHPALNGLEALQRILAQIEARGGTTEG